MTCLNHLCIVADDSGQNELALRYGQEAVIQSDRLRHSFNRAATRNNLADAYVGAGRSEEAVAITTRALEIAHEKGSVGIVGAILHTRGRAFLALGRRDEARADAEAARSLVAGSPFEEDVRQLLEDLAGTSESPRG